MFKYLINSVSYKSEIQSSFENTYLSAIVVGLSKGLNLFINNSAASIKLSFNFIYPELLIFLQILSVL